MNPPSERNVDIARVLDAADFGKLKWLAEDPAGYDSVRARAEELLRLLEARQVQFVLAGGLAVLQWVQGRNTEDIDLVMSPEELARLPELTVVYRDQDFLRTDFHGILVDVLFTKNRLFDLVRKRYAVKRRFGAYEILCANPEGLVLMKLFALPSLYRQQRFQKVTVYQADIANLLQYYEMDTEPLFKALAPHLLGTDIVELREIVMDIRSQIARFTAGRFGEDSSGSTSNP